MRAVSLILVFVVGLAFAGTNDLELARQALRDGLWSVARLHAARVGGDLSRQLVLESHAREGDWKAVGACLDEWPGANGPLFDYYRAVVAGDVRTAIGLLKSSGVAEDLVEAKMLEADLQSKAGDLAAARKLWTEVAAVSNLNERTLATVAVNLEDPVLLRKAFAEARSVTWRRMAGLRLGTVLLREAATFAEGTNLVRTIVRDVPDAKGAREAYLIMAETLLADGDNASAAAAYHEAAETWPDVAKQAKVQEGWGWALMGLGRLDEALAAFVRAEELAPDDESRAMALYKQGDVLSRMGRGEAAMARYRLVLERYPKVALAERIGKIVRVREMEAQGRELYREFRFQEAAQLFASVAAEEPARKPKMDYYEVLCLYGQGLDDEAGRKAREIAENGPDAAVRADARLWLAKFLYNRGDWKESGRLFESCAAQSPEGAAAPEALVWAARAAFVSGDCNQAIQTATRLVERYPKSASRLQGLLIQGESLIELARFDEAVLVLEGVALSADASSADHVRAQMLKADALFALGADNAARYQAALDAYRALAFGGALNPSDRITVSFKIARTLEKLKRTDEAVDQYYTQVVLAYREARGKGLTLDDEARAAFSRAAFGLSDEYERRGSDFQARKILELVATSDVPAAAEAVKRIERISKKGGFL